MTSLLASSTNFCEVIVITLSKPCSSLPKSITPTVSFSDLVYSMFLVLPMTICTKGSSSVMLPRKPGKIHDRLLEVRCDRPWKSSSPTILPDVESRTRADARPFPSHEKPPTHPTNQTAGVKLITGQREERLRDQLHLLPHETDPQHHHLHWSRQGQQVNNMRLRYPWLRGHQSP